MRVPLSQIKENQYTSGNEFVEKKSFKPYKGNYYILGEKYYSGKTYNPNAIEIVKKSAQTARVNSLTGTQLKYFFNAPESIQHTIASSEPVRGINTNVPLSTTENKDTKRYFIKQKNTSPVLIREVSEETYNTTTDPIYIKAIINWNTQSGFNTKDIEALDQYYMTGIKTFLLG